MKRMGEIRHYGWFVFMGVLMAIIIALGLSSLWISKIVSKGDLKDYQIITEKGSQKSNQTKENLSMLQDLIAEKNMMNNNQVLTFSTGEYPPFVYTENGEITGLSYEVVRLVLSKMNIQSQIIYEPWNRGLNELNHGRRVGAFPYAKTPERQAVYLFSDELYESDLNDKYFIGFNLPQTELNQIETWSDLKGLRVGGVYGYYYLSTFDAQQVQLDISATEKECLQKLVDGKIDLAVFNPLVSKYLVNKYFPELEAKFGKTKFKLNPEENGDFLMVQANQYDNELFLHAFNQTLSTLKAKGEIQKIVNRYLEGN